MTAPSEPGLAVVRATTTSELADVKALFLEYAQSLSFSLCFQNFDQEVASLPGAYAPPSGCLLLAREGGVAAGCIAFRDSRNRICEMKRLYVRPAFRGRALGELLVTRLIAEARHSGYGRMRLDTVSSSMQSAIHLYRRLGFLEVPPYYDNPIEGALYLERAL